MSSSSATVSSPPIARERAGLALLAGVLGLPGNTIAWDLPGGGYWIGWPLTAIALVLGLSSWPEATSQRRWMAGAAIVLGLGEALFTAGWFLFG